MTGFTRGQDHSRPEKEGVSTSGVGQDGEQEDFETGEQEDFETGTVRTTSGYGGRVTCLEETTKTLGKVFGGVLQAFARSRPSSTSFSLYPHCRGV